QGPRLESAAEVDRLERDGCTMVGMTTMPEASLARELDMRYAVCALAVNHAAGRVPGDTSILAQLERHTSQGAERFAAVLERLIPAIC
ncbi:MAG: S-methyl-5'-thioadenosine phosphorylase, partial [Proteobacteria bacterium]|nr:S-methyl-5'-thioadenosine phosphorylase [Pseudomonadota bacterium]